MDVDCLPRAANRIADRIDRRDYSCESSLVNSSRLVVLAALNDYGPMHGHQIRHKAQENRTQLWSDVAVGALYGALGRLQREGLIEAIRTEREGNYPERVIYAITEEGQRSLRVVIHDTLQTVVHHFDPFDLALAHSGPIEADQLSTLLQNRSGELHVRRNTLQHVLDFFSQWLNTAEAEVIRHVLMRLDADIAWHESVIDRVPDIARESHEIRPGEQAKEAPS